MSIERTTSSKPTYLARVGRLVAVNCSEQTRCSSECYAKNLRQRWNSNLRLLVEKFKRHLKAAWILIIIRVKIKRKFFTMAQMSLSIISGVRFEKLNSNCLFFQRREKAKEKQPPPPFSTNNIWQVCSTEKHLTSQLLQLSIYRRNT